MSKYLAGALQARNAPTPQSKPLPGRETDMSQNNAGGFVFKTGDWERLRRFLILGSAGNTYYQKESDITGQNLDVVLRCVAADATKVVDLAAELSASGRVPKNDPALMALAVAARLGDLQGRRAAYQALPRVARTFTHLSHFLTYTQLVKKGWSRGLRTAVSHWYTDKSMHDLVYSGIKYQGRDGWSNSDALILAHPSTASSRQSVVFNWMVHGWPSVGEQPHDDGDLAQLWAFEYLKKNPTEDNAVKFIQEYRLPREALPTEVLKSAKVWEALLVDMPITAMVRNLANMTRCGLLAPMSAASKTIITRLHDTDRLRKARVHPLALLSALRTYSGSYRGLSKGAAYTPVQQVIDALDDAFYASFAMVEPTGKRIMIATDISGSMGSGEIAGIRGLTPMEAAITMALVVAHTEQDYMIMGFNDKLTPLPISPKMRLDTIMSRLHWTGGATDASAPWTYAKDNKLELDAVYTLTDNETWCGGVHPHKARLTYSKGRDTKAAVIAFTATDFTIADPNDPNELDFVGFDTAAPALLADFTRGLV